MTNVVFQDADISVLNAEAIADFGKMKWELENTLAPVSDGEYVLRYEALNSESSDFNEWFHYTIQAQDKIRVVDGEFDVASVMRVAEQLMDAAGYWGTFIEDVAYNAADNCFELTVGS